MSGREQQVYPEGIFTASCLDIHETALLDESLIHMYVVSSH